MSQHTKKVVEKLKKSFPAAKVFGYLKDLVKPQESFSTGSLALDYKIRYGGIPRGRITHIFGPERSLKSTIAFKTALDALNRDENNVVMYLDFERTMDSDDAIRSLSRLGYSDKQISESFLYVRDTPEESFDIAESFVELDEAAVLIVDSIGAIFPKRGFSKDYEDNQKIGLRVALLQDFLNRVNQKNNNCAVVLINQARENMSFGHGPAYKFSGGFALRHLASLTLDVSGYHTKDKKSDKEDGNDTVVLKAKIHKCKLGGENAQISVEFDLNKGDWSLDKDCFLLAYMLELIDNSGAWYTLFEKPKRGGESLLRVQGQERIESEIKARPELMKHIENVIRQEILKNAKGGNWVDVESSTVLDQPILQPEVEDENDPSAVYDYEEDSVDDTSP